MSCRTVAAARSKLTRDEVKWQELLSHFRSVQMKHEKYRRQAAGGDVSPLAGLGLNGAAASSSGSRGQTRKMTGSKPDPAAANANAGPSAPRPAGVLSPLNPRARAASGANVPLMSAFSSSSRPLSPTSATGTATKPRRTLGLRK